VNFDVDADLNFDNEFEAMAKDMVQRVREYDEEQRRARMRRLAEGISKSLAAHHHQKQDER
jgi:hypothetical protein